MFNYSGEGSDELIMGQCAAFLPRGRRFWPIESFSFELEVEPVAMRRMLGTLILVFAGCLGSHTPRVLAQTAQIESVEGQEQNAEGEEGEERELETDRDAFTPATSTAGRRLTIV